MDQTKQESNVPFFVKILGLIFYLAIWLVAGGIATLLPFISHNLEKFVGALTVGGVLFSWLLLPFTFLLYFFSSSKFAFLPFTFNAIIWLSFDILLWLRLGR